MLRKDSEDAIKLLREQGVGYVKIGQMLGLGRDDVRNYCVKAGLGGRRSNAAVGRNSEESVAHRVKKSDSDIEYVSGYETVKSRIMVRCLVCGYEWEVAYVQAVYQVCRCPWCADAKREYNEYVRLLDNKMRLYHKALKEREREEEWKITHARACVVCGNEFISSHGSMFCSDRCRKKYNNRKGDRRINSGIVDDSDITLESLFKRDKGVCHICGKPCDYEDYTVAGDVFIAGNWYPSIDHVVPVSKGGRHSWDNVKLAHRLCNSVKSNKT